MQILLIRFGNWLNSHQKAIRYLQWCIIFFYAVLIVIPPFLPLPAESATIVNNLTIFAQFMFWGIWWPFVLLSIIFFGRLWCGVLCPEGALSEFANKFGRQRGIPRWVRWGGWPFVSFLLTTLYGQMTSVYQYPKPVALILGGSTVAAIIIGLLYGKNSRVWCKYLCPVTGVFSLLSRLSPYRYQPDKVKWDGYQGNKIISINCPTLQPLRTMVGAADCLMCGKCNNYREAIVPKWRSLHEEIIVYGKENSNIWTSLLLIYGLCGVALAAFQWTNSFWLVHLRDTVESWFLVHKITWVFNNAPWWIFTNYPEQDDVFTWVFGFELVTYILCIGICIGSLIFILISSATIIIRQRYELSVFNHLSLALIPLGAASVFIGLFALTVTLLEKYANKGFVWIIYLKVAILVLATFWSTFLTYKIILRYCSSWWRITSALFIMFLSIVIIDYSWVLVLHIWSIKADKLPWNTLWVNFSLEQN